MKKAGDAVIFPALIYLVCIEIIINAIKEQIYGKFFNISLGGPRKIKKTAAYVKMDTTICSSRGV